MAKEFVAKVSVDIGDFIAAMQQVSQKSGTIPEALAKAAKAAEAEVEKLKAKLQGLEESGKGSGASAEKLKEALAKATTEADRLGSAVKKIDDGLKASSGGALDGLVSKFKEGQEAASAGGGMFGSLAGKLGELVSPAGAAAAALAAVTGGLAKTVEIGREFETNMQSLSAVTGLTGAPLEDLGNRARGLAKQFGGEAKGQLESFQGVLSKFGADLAKYPEQLGTVANSINTLGKAGGLDAKTAMDTLANSMLQFGVNVGDAGEAAEESKRFINVLAASARVGAAEIPQVGQAVLVAGVAAKGAKVSFEETNAAIQVLAAGGKVGAEAGTALRNVLGTLGEGRFMSKDAAQGLKDAGVDVSKLSDKSIPLSDRLAELKKIMEDSALVSKVFGKENASAASILINGADTVKDWTKQVTDTADATTQAAKNMNTFSERMSRIKASVEDVFIGAFQKIGPVINVLLDNLGGIASVLGPIIAGFAAYAVVSNASALATGAVTIATNVAKVAQLALNAVMAANPIGLVVAALGAAVVAYAAFSKTATESAQAQLAQAEAQQQVIRGQIEDNEAKQKGEKATQDLAARYTELAKKTALTKAEQTELKDVAIKLNGQYPELIDLTKSYQDNLAGVAEIAKKSVANLQDLSKQNDELNKQMVESQKVVSFSKRNVAVAELQDAIKKLDFSTIEKSFGLTFSGASAKAKGVFDEFKKQDFTQEIFGVKTEKELDAVQLKLVQFFNRNQQNIGDSTVMLEIQNKISAAIEAQRAALTVAGLLQKDNTAAAEKQGAAEQQAAAIKDKKEKGEKTAFELAKQKYELAVASIKLAQQEEAKAITNLALSENRKLSETEELRIKELQLKAEQDTLQAAKDIFKIKGEGADLRTTVSLDKKETSTAQKDVQTIISSLQDKITALRFSIVPKEGKDLSKDMEKALKENVASIKAEVGIDQLLASPNTNKVQSDINALTQLGLTLATAGFQELSAEALRQAAELQNLLQTNSKKAALERRQIEIDSMTDGQKKELAQRLLALDKQEAAEKESAEKIGVSTLAIEANYRAKREALLKQDIRDRLNLAIEALDSEGARSLAKKILQLQKERDEILSNEQLTQQQRQAIKSRYDKQIAALQTGTDEETQKAKAALDKQEADLNKSLAQRKVNYAQYREQLDEINKRRAEIDQQTTDRTNAVKTVLSADDSQLQDKVAQAAQDIPKDFSAIGQLSIEELTKALQQGTDIKDALKGVTDPGLVELSKTFGAMQSTAASSFGNMTDLGIDSFTKLAAAGSLAFLSISAASKRSAEGTAGAMNSVNSLVGGRLSKLSTDLEQTFDLRGKGALDSVQDLGKVFSLAFAGAEVGGKNLGASIKDSLTKVNQVSGAALTKFATEADQKFTEAGAKGEFALGSLGESAAATFLSMEVAGKKGADAAKETAVKTVGQLLTVYVAPIIASTLAFLGPFALPVATAAIAFIQGEFKKAVSGFKVGRHPGANEDPDQPVGMAHGGEDIFTAQISRRNRALFSHLHKGGDAEAFFSTKNVTTLVPLPAGNGEEGSLLRAVVDRLDSLERTVAKSSGPDFKRLRLDVQHDDSLAIKAKDRRVQVRRATV